MNSSTVGGPGNLLSRAGPGTCLSRSLVGALAVLFLIPVAHKVWDADAPGRCIRTLMAFDRPHHEDPLRALAATIEKAPTSDPCLFEKATIEEFEESDEITPFFTTLETTTPPSTSGLRPSRLVRPHIDPHSPQRLRC